MRKKEMQTVDDGLAELDALNSKYRRQKIALLEAGILVDTLRRDVPAVCRRIEMLVSITASSDRATWSPAFREQWNAWYEDGKTKGINFSLAVAAELARRMLATAQDGDERGTAAYLLGNALRAHSDQERLVQPV